MRNRTIKRPISKSENTQLHGNEHEILWIYIKLCEKILPEPGTDRSCANETEQFAYISRKHPLLTPQNPVL